MQHPVLAALRLATHTRHEAIERLMPLDAGFGLAHYLAMLRGFDSFLRAWEPAVESALPPRLRPWFRARARAAAAAQDLQALAAASVQVSVALPRMDGRSAALGSMYVVEGSTLGGELIARHAVSHLGVDQHRGVTFFGGRAPHTGRMWREFCTVLEAEVDDRGAAADAACATFDSLAAVLAALRPKPAGR